MASPARSGARGVPVKSPGCVENADGDSDTPQPVSRPPFPVSPTADRRPHRTRTGNMDNDDDISRASRAKRGSPYLNTDQAAAYLTFSSRLLKRLRRAGKGPVFRLHRRFVQYHIADLHAWSDAPAEGDKRHDSATRA